MVGFRIARAFAVLGACIGLVAGVGPASAQDAPQQQPQPPPGYEQQPVIQPYQGDNTAQPPPQGQQDQGQVPVVVQEGTYPTQQQPGYGAQPVYVTPPQEQRQQIGTESRPRLGLVIGGAIMFSVPYAIAVGSAFTDGCNCGYFAIPVAGPFIQMTDVNPDALFSGFAYVGLAVWGLLQAAGLTMFALGFALADEVPVYAKREREREWAMAPWFVPDPTGGSGGLSLFSEF